MNTTPPALSKIGELQAKLRIALENRRHKEAIAFYKDLLKLERRPEWEQGLAEAYRQRALQVAAKGMWQEALILWENQLKLAPQAAPSDAYLGWLAQAGQWPKLAKLLAEAGSALEQGTVGKRLAETLAVLALQNEKLLAALPPEHPIAKHHPLIKQAIKAYCAGRDDELEETLRQIPSRSPYRNVRTLLKALLLIGQDRAAGLALLARIEADSACQGLARLLLRHAQPTGPDAAADFELPPKQQAFIQKINGYSKAQLNLAKDAKKIAKNPNPRLLLTTVLAHRDLLGESTCRRFCLNLLVEFPEGMDAFQKAFGKLSPFDRHRLQAQQEEFQRYYPDAASHWEHAIHELAKRPDTERDVLDEALIWRRIADLAKMERPEIAVDALRRSLALDPDDRASYLGLIRLCEQLDASKDAQQWLDQGLKRLPKDVELLGLAMNAANRRKAFKKAAGLAKTVLEIDPINSPARQLLIGAHLGHARKQFRAGRHELAQQELSQARVLEPRRRDAALCILEGLLALRQQGKPAAAGLLEEGWRLAGGGLAAQFQFNIESLCLGLPIKATAGLVPGITQSHTAKPAELAGFAKLLGQYAEEKKYLGDALKPLLATLKKSFKQPELTKDDYFNLCQIFARAAQFELLKECATAALQHFPLWPVATYYQIYAKSKGVARWVSQFDENRLEAAMHQARQANDPRAGMLIESFLRKLDELDEEDEYFDDELPSGFELKNMDLKPSPDLQKRVLELDDLPHAELLAMVSKALPDVPVKELPHRELLDIARLLLMQELGLNLDRLFGRIPLPGNIKKPPKSR